MDSRSSYDLFPDQILRGKPVMDPASYAARADTKSRPGSSTSIKDVEAGVSPEASEKRTQKTRVSLIRSIALKLGRPSRIDTKSEELPKKRITRSGWAIITLSVLLAGFIITFIIREVPRHHTSGAEMIVSRWGLPSSSTQLARATWPSDFSRDIKPIPCHSHNDYWRHVPLYDALATGCTGVEADVWFTPELQDDLYVGHTRNSLRSERTLKSLYIDPLFTILNNQNNPPQLNRSTYFRGPSNQMVGVFDSSPSTSLTLLVDLKTASDTTFPILQAALQPLFEAGYLTTFSHLEGLIPGPITVVATGNTNFTTNILSPSDSEPRRTIFFDAPLPALSNLNPSGENIRYNSGNTYYASVSFSKEFSKQGPGFKRQGLVEIVRKQIQSAKDRGLVSRYWDTPGSPVTNEVWRVLRREGVGVFNTDHLDAFKKFWEGK